MLGKLPRDRCGNDHVIRSRVKKASSQSISSLLNQPTPPRPPAIYEAGSTSSSLEEHRRVSQVGAPQVGVGRVVGGGHIRWSSLQVPGEPHSRALLLPTASGTAGTRTPAQKPPDWGHNADQLTPTSQCAATRTFLWIRHIYAGMPGGSKGREGGV